MYFYKKSTFFYYKLKIFAYVFLFLFLLGAGRGKVSLPNCPPMYMDLVYIPNHSSAKNVDAEFFNRVRSSYYVVSGNDLTAQEPSRAVLDALLEGKAQWETNMQVSWVALRVSTFFSSEFSEAESLFFS